MDTNCIQTLLSFYQEVPELPAFPDATLWMWFDANVLLRGTIGFLLRYIRARWMGRRVSRRAKLGKGVPEVTWFVTTRDAPGPLLHTLVTGLSTTRYPNLRIVILDCGSSHPADEAVLRLGDNRISIVTAKRTQPEWYRWLCANLTSEYCVVTHDDLHFVGEDWLADVIAPMVADHSIGCVCGEAFPIRLNTVEPNGSRVDITFGLSTWMWAARRDAITHQACDFSFSKRGIGSSGRLEVWDQGGLWLKQLEQTGWGITIQSEDDARKWQHFENFDWTRDTGDTKYARLKQYQRELVTVLGDIHLMAVRLKFKR